MKALLKKKRNRGSEQWPFGAIVCFVILGTNLKKFSNKDNDLIHHLYTL